MKLEISKEECIRLAELEGDAEIGAGALSPNYELALLLTTARVLRAFLREYPTAEGHDIRDMDEALAPFGPSNVVPIQSDGCATDNT